METLRQGMKIGYIRVSRDKQLTDLQEDAMKREQCDKIFRDKMSGARQDRPGFEEMLNFVRPGDIIVVFRLDRLGRSLKNLIETVNLLSERGIELRSLKETIDTTTPTGKLIFHIIGAMAEFERDLISERTKLGLEAARARGRFGGRKKATDSISSKKLARAKELYAEKKMTVKEIMRLTGIGSKSTFYKYVAGGES